MNFNDFLFKVFDLLNKTNSNISITLTPQKGGIIDILVCVYDDVIVDTFTDINSFSEKEKRKMIKIINAINEHC